MKNADPRGGLAASTNSQGVVREMRLLVHATENVRRPDEGEAEERLVGYTVTTALMVILVVLIFATSALPDLLPRLGNVLQAHL